MEYLQLLFGAVRPFVPVLAAVAAVIAGLFAVRWLLERRWGELPESRFRIQLIMLALSLAGVLAVVMALPVSETLRGQLLSLIGILLSAAIALSSTTFLGNALAGILLRVVKSFRLGDFIRVGEHFGRASERGLFHVEIQTEDRDLTTLPNLYLVTHPVKVVRDSGTIVSATVSLGYDVAHEEVERLLLQAAERVGLQEPFVYITELGDFSVKYRIAGLLTEVKQLLSTRSRLHAAMLSELHRAQVEIVSPSFMNTRALAEGMKFIPTAPVLGPAGVTAGEPVAEDVVFDKAEEAEHLESVTDEHQSLTADVERLEGELESAATDQEREQIERRLDEARAERERLARKLGEAASRIENRE